MNKLELLPLAGCTEQEIAKYERHRAQRLAGKKPCPDLRRNYIKCNGRIETYLRDLAKAEKNDPRKTQEKKNAVVWALNLAQCYADNAAHMPEGYVTDKQLIHEEIYRVFIEGVNGVLPTLNLMDTNLRGKVIGPMKEVMVALEENAIPIKWDEAAFRADLKGRLQGTCDAGVIDGIWEETEPVAFPVEFIRTQGVRKVLREVAEEMVITYFPSMKKA